MKNPFKRSTIASLEAELANLTSRSQTLETRRQEADARLQAAKSARRNVLASDPSADLTALNRDVREAEDEIETLDGVLFDIREQIDATQATMAETRDRDERERVAKELQAIAKAFDAGAAELASAIAQVEKAATKMLDALPETLHVTQFRGDVPTNQAEAVRLVACVLAEGLAKAMPDALPIEVWGPWGSQCAHLVRAFAIDAEQPTLRPGGTEVETPPVDTKTAATLLVTDRLRQRAERIVAGELPADLADQAAFVPVDRNPPPTNVYVEIGVTAHFSFWTKDRRGREIVTRHSVKQVPKPVADAAAAAGVAFATDTPEGQQKRAELLDHRRRLTSWAEGPVGFENCVAVDVEWEAPADVDLQNAEAA